MTSVINAAHAEGVNVVLTVTMMAWDYDYTNMSALLNNSTRRTKLAGQIAAAVAARNADGVNLDFEPMPNALQTAYTQFVRDVRTAIGSSAHLSVATTGGAATWDEGYDLAGITGAGAADALMVMAYDFNWSGSTHAGGVSPIDSPYALDVNTAMANYLAKVPASKLIWGVPYYGRAWTTTGSTVNGRTCSGTGSCTAASWSIRYDDAVEGAAAKGRKWDAVGQVPWYTYKSPTYDEQVQAYYDDAVSLDVKHELIIANGLRGVGIWHLTMDGSRRELWDQLVAELRRPAVPRHRRLRLPRAHHLVGVGGDHHRVRQRALLPACERHPCRDGRVPGEGPRPDGRQRRSVRRRQRNRSRAEHQPDRRGRDHERMHVEPVLSRPRRDPRADGELHRSGARPARDERRRVHGRRGIDARERDQPTGGRGHRDGVRLEPILPIEPGQPRADGRLPPSGARSVAPSRNRSAHGHGARSAYGTDHRRLGTVARVLITSFPGA